MIENIVLIIAVCLVVGAVVFALLIHLNIFRNYHYICQKCSTSYKPDTFLQSLFGLNAVEQRKLKCPNCNKREWAALVKD